MPQIRSSSEPSPGRSFPIGPRLRGDGANFSIYAKHAEAMELLFFDDAAATGPSRVIRLTPEKNRTYHYWHVFVPGLKQGQIFGWRAHGPFNPDLGLRFDPGKLLLDPYARAVVVPDRYSRAAASQPGDNVATAMKSVLADLRLYDWAGDTPPRRPFSRTVIYEMHVGGFTKSPSSGLPPSLRGTYRGFIEKIPYLQELGVTAVELMPVFQFDAEDAPEGRRNYWGYAPVSFFAPHAAYSSRKDPLGPLDEFRDLVKALHRAGLEVILDVVFNHTAEGDERGPTLSWRGLANDAYYILQEHPRFYANYSGCGNTLNPNQSLTRHLILNSLRHWVEAMHVDGFRFDLASILSRDEKGRVLDNPPLLWDIETDPVLCNAKIIAEVWDAGGLYQLGHFIGDSFKEWNGAFRDDIRRFLRGDRGMVTRIPNRLLGSPDLFEYENREPEQSINFVTCHDGFTLNDLVSYEHKHNEANGEGNRDGLDDNTSWNGGVEGESENPEVESLRQRQIRNFMTLLFISVGTPMIHMGDEVRRTQRGNNNAFCQDNEVSWFDWTLPGKHPGFLRFVRTWIRHRLRGNARKLETISLNALLRESRYEWHGVELGKPDWGDDSHALAFTARLQNGRVRLHGMLNGYWEALDFKIPEPGPFPWRRWVDTSLASPEDILDYAQSPIVPGPRYRVAAHSIVFVVSASSG
ncbi:MAG TPA: glycogen debranching protein GlgX [Planctomycetota bacterium]|nr:glycogen debranching protein GlgX [Planctomycetota bacterium]